MSKETIAKALKLYRQKNKYSVTDVVVKLNECGHHVSEKTVYGWESGQSLPNSERLVELCNIYNIHDFPYTLGDVDATDIITPNTHEAKVIKNYRTHANMQDAVDKLLDID